MLGCCEYFLLSQSSVLALTPRGSHALVTNPRGPMVLLYPSQPHAHLAHTHIHIHKSGKKKNYSL